MGIVLIFNCPCSLPNMFFNYDVNGFCCESHLVSEYANISSLSSPQPKADFNEIKFSLLVEALCDSQKAGFL